MDNNDIAAPHFVDVHVGARIRARRKLLGVSQQQLADAVGKTFQQIQKYESGSNRVSSSVLYLFARSLQVDIGHFFEGLPTIEQDLDVTLEADQVTVMMAKTGGPELARMYVELEPAQRAGVLNVVRTIHEIAVDARAAA